MTGIKIETSNSSADEKTVRIYFQYLLDSIISQNDYDNLKVNLDSLKNALPQETADIDKLQVNISKVIEDFKATKAYKGIGDTEKEINDFVKASLEKLKKRVGDDFKAKMDEIETGMSSARMNSTKNIQAFLSSDAMKVIDMTINLKLVEGVYDSTVKYIAEGGIEYEFSLNTRSLEIFKEPIKFGSLEKGVRIPVSSGSNWVGKETQVDYERIDRYYLSSASISKGNLFVVFSDPDSDGKVTFVMSRGNDSAFLSIEYSIDKQTIDITGNSALSSTIEMERIQDPLDRIYGSIMEIEGNKMKLTHLSDNGNEIIDTGNIRQFAMKVFEMKKDLLQNVLKNQPGTKTESFNVKEKLALAGTSGKEIGKMLGIEI
ncbi:MAG: hypothetical protein M1496_01020 [Candidatus Thermoplasmatota archaeon]|jgi:hypothetical protein|nr:hypothetical protein [Candidatus Thermoplasmatota archaeon]